MKRTTLAIVVLGAILGSAVGARDKELNLPLKWNPNQKSSIPAIDITGGLRPIAIAPIVDKRDKGKQIGENTEGKVAVPVYTSSDVVAFVAENLTRQLKSAGLDVAPGETGDRVMRSELIEFWVNEGKLYLGSIRLKVTITDAGGKELWSALVDGSSDNFGRSLKPDNYTEALSNSMQGLAAKLVGAPGFRQAIVKGQ